MKPTELNDLLQLIEAKCEHNPIVEGICVDSRLAKPGDLFFALPGEKVDGHSYISQAASLGAIAAVVEKKYPLHHGTFPLIYVDDTLKALQMMAKNVLKQRNAKIVAITGSVGKTTTKDFTAALLKPYFRIASSPGNSNSQIGLPLTIMNHTNGDEQVLILEMGMTHPGQISELIKIAPPDIAIITTIALVHACNFESLEEIAAAKSEIFSHPKTKLGIVDKEFAEISRKGDFPKCTFSVTDNNADFFLYEEHGFLHINENQKNVITLPLLPVVGSHNKHNFLAATAAARALGIDWNSIRSSMASLCLPECRLEIIKKHGATFVNDSYNASEKSLKAALSSLPPTLPGGKTIAVIGEMLELGKFSEKCHREVGEFSLNYVDVMFCLGKECWPIYDIWRSKGKPVEWKLSRSDVLESLRKQLNPGDVILLKGSRTNQLWKILEEI